MSTETGGNKAASLVDMLRAAERDPLGELAMMMAFCEVLQHQTDLPDGANYGAECYTDELARTVFGDIEYEL